MIDNIFHSAIKTAVENKNISVRTLGKKTGISFSNIAGFIRGEHDITTDKLIKLLEALKISVTID